MKLAIASSNKEKTSFRLKVMGPKQKKFKKLMAFSYKLSTMTYSRTSGNGVREIPEILRQWGKDVVVNKEKTIRQSNITWTRAGVRKVLEMFDAKGRRFSLSQMVTVLNEKESRHLWRHHLDVNRDLTKSNLQALLKKLFPATKDTQYAVSLLEQVHSHTHVRSCPTCSQAAHELTCTRICLRIHSCAH